MLTILLEIVLELVVQVIGEFLLTLGWESIGHTMRGSRKANPIQAMVGTAILGSLCGAASALVQPERVLPASKLPGVSLVVAPIVSGVLMQAIGDRRRRAGKDTTILATFWGGTVFAFTLAVARFFLVRVP